MICPHCERYLEDGVAFCIYCGQRLGKFASDEAGEDDPFATMEDNPFADAGQEGVLAAGPEGLAQQGIPQVDSAMAGVAAAGMSAAPVAPASAQERGSVRSGGRLHADDEIARRMNDLGDEPKVGTGRKVAAGVILAALAAAAIGFGVTTVLPDIMNQQSSSAAQSSSTSGSASSSSSSKSSKSSSSSKSSKSSKSSSSSKSGGKTEDTKYGSTLENASTDNQGTEGSEEVTVNAGVSETVEVVPTTGEETTTGIVNTYVPNPEGEGEWRSASNGYSVTATSISPTEGSVSHAPELVLDGDKRTAWNTNMSGIDQSITIELDKAKKVKKLRILNGYNKTSASGTDLFKANARAKKILVEWDGGSKYYTLDDLRDKYQTIKLKKQPKTGWIKITIKSVYPGDSYDDCCISEIEIK